MILPKRPHFLKLKTELMGGSPNGDDKTCMASLFLSPSVSAYSKQILKESSNDVTIILLCL